MIGNYDFTVLNIIVSKENEDRDVKFNMAHNAYEEQVPMGSSLGAASFVLSLSQDGLVHPLEFNLNTQHSCNLNKAQAPCGDDGDVVGEAVGAGGEDDDIDKFSSDFEIDMHDYKGVKMCYKAWKRGEENDLSEEETYDA
ncbi:hypothetical protein D1007_45068 [Hordeum vulgare]|nr:hypothetical protein D1007_45068 [Hordeum vulgare]